MTVALDNKKTGMIEEEGACTSQAFAKKYCGAWFTLPVFAEPKLVDDLLIWCHQHHASDITIQTNAPVMAEIAGKWVPVTKRATNNAMIKIILKQIFRDAGPSQIKGGKDLDTAYQINDLTNRGKSYRFRVNATGGQIAGHAAVQITIRSLPDMPLSLDELGVEQAIIDHIRPANGMVLITGATGSGKSTLMSAIVRRLLERKEGNEKIIEFSAPIEYTYDKVDKDPSSLIFPSEVGVNLKAAEGEKPFAHAVRNALRRKPSIIILGESRDTQTMQASIEAALTGHLLYTTMHTIGVIETLRKAVLFFPGNERDAMAIDIIQTLRMSITQTLLPCTLGGKIGCREYMVFTPAMRAHLLAVPFNTWPLEITNFFKQGHGRTMEHSARLLMQQNQITKETYHYISAKGESCV